jgi:hypothetical protein
MSLRGVFYEEDDARAAAARLVRDGFEATVERDRLAGEDDDEDHPWAVLTDAPDLVLEVVVEQYDGWLDRDAVPGQDGPVDAPPPLELPDAPRRVKGHFSDG